MSDYSILIDDVARLTRERAAMRHAIERAEAALCVAIGAVGPQYAVREGLAGAVAECRAALAGMAEGERIP